MLLCQDYRASQGKQTSVAMFQRKLLSPSSGFYTTHFGKWSCFHPREKALGGTSSDRSIIKDQSQLLNLEYCHPTFSLEDGNCSSSQNMSTLNTIWWASKVQKLSYLNCNRTLYSWFKSRSPT